VLGTTRAERPVVTDDPVKRRRELETQVERWTADAKKLADAGKASAALDLYRQAADELPGAPWLQQRTAELARKLQQHDVAIAYYRQAATAFQIADFPKRAVAPLRTAWSLAIQGLPGTSKLLVGVAVELMHVYRQQGFAADATVTFERTNAALRSRGFSEIGTQVLDPIPPSSRPPSTARSSAAPTSGVAPRSSVSPPAEGSPTSRGRAVAGLFGRR
jgi:tetratricopeptide (TPR) repeat protein